VLTPDFTFCQLDNQYLLAFPPSRGDRNVYKTLANCAACTDAQTAKCLHWIDYGLTMYSQCVISSDITTKQLYCNYLHADGLSWNVQEFGG
jgi:hypothetical protein